MTRPALLRSLGWFFPVALLVAAGCASGGGASGETANPTPRPADCRLVEAGWVQVYFGLVRGRLRISDRLEAMGYEGLRDSRPITEQWRAADGTYQSRVVGREGIGLRWNDPACSIGR